MAVQKNKKTRSRRDMRRSHDEATLPTLSVHKKTGQKHLRHNMTADGFYKNEQIISPKVKSENPTDLS